MRAGTQTDGEKYSRNENKEESFYSTTLSRVDLADDFERVIGPSLACRGHGLFTVIIRRGHLNQISKLPSVWSQQSAALGSSKQLPRTLKMKIVDAHKAGGDYKKLANSFQVTSVHNFIQKRYVKGAVEVEMRSRKIKNHSIEIALMVVGKNQSQDPRLTAEEDLAGSACVSDCSTAPAQI